MTPGRPCRLSSASPALTRRRPRVGVELSIVMPCLRATPSQAASARRAAFCRSRAYWRDLGGGSPWTAMSPSSASLARSTAAASSIPTPSRRRCKAPSSTVSPPRFTARSPSRMGASRRAISTPIGLCVSTRCPSSRFIMSRAARRRRHGRTGNFGARARRHQRDLRCNRRALTACRPCQSRVVRLSRSRRSLAQRSSRCLTSAS